LPELKQLLVLLIFLLHRRPLPVGNDLALGVGAVPADQDEGRKKDRFERDDHREPPGRVLLDPEPNPAAEPHEIDVRRAASSPRTRLITSAAPVLGVLGAPLGMP
jgi:hypothetical protein